MQTCVPCKYGGKRIFLGLNLCEVPATSRVIHIVRDYIYWFIRGAIPLFMPDTEGSNLYGMAHLFMTRLNQRYIDFLLMDAESRDILYKIELKVIEDEKAAYKK